MKEYIIKVDEDKKDIMGNCPLVDKPRELIRCKDCKHGTANDIGQIQCNMTIGDDDIHEQDWFCADGERR